MRTKSSFRLSLYAGLSSLFVALLYQAVKSFIALPALEQMRRAETIAVVSIGVQVVIEPLLSRVRISLPERGLSKRREGFLVRLLSLLVIVLVSLSDGLLHEYLGETISPRGWTGVVQLVGSLIGPSVITFSWLRGVRKAPPRAGLYGLYAAISIGICFLVIDSLFLMNHLPQNVPRPPRWIVLMEGEIIFLSFFLGPALLTAYVASGFLGGLAADRGWCRRAWQRIAIGLGVAAIVQPVSLLLVYGLFFRAARQKLPGLSLWSWVAEPAISSIGWVLGFVLDPDADALFQGARTDESLSLSRESVRFARAAVVIAVLMMAVAFGCLTIGSFVTADALKRGSRSAAAPSPSAKST